MLTEAGVSWVPMIHERLTRAWRQVDASGHWKRTDPEPWKMKTLDRYVVREILPPLFLSLLIFTFILEIPPVMQQLEQLVAKGVPWGVAGRILLTLIPQALGFWRSTPLPRMSWWRWPKSGPTLSS